MLVRRCVIVACVLLLVLRVFIFYTQEALVPPTNVSQAGSTGSRASAHAHKTNIMACAPHRFGNSLHGPTHGQEGGKHGAIGVSQQDDISRPTGVCVCVHPHLRKGATSYWYLKLKQESCWYMEVDGYQNTKTSVTPSIFVLRG